MRQPYLNKRGDLIIPPNADPKYHFWKEGGQPLYRILEELAAESGILSGYSGRIKILREQRIMTRFNSMFSWVLVNLIPYVGVSCIHSGWTFLILNMLHAGYKHLRGENR